MIARTAKVYAVHIVPTLWVRPTANLVLNPAAACSALYTKFTLRGTCGWIVCSNRTRRWWCGIDCARAEAVFVCSAGDSMEAGVFLISSVIVTRSLLMKQTVQAKNLYHYIIVCYY